MTAVQLEGEDSGLRPALGDPGVGSGDCVTCPGACRKKQALEAILDCRDRIWSPPQFLRWVCLTPLL